MTSSGVTHLGLRRLAQRHIVTEGFTAGRPNDQWQKGN